MADGSADPRVAYRWGLLIGGCPQKPLRKALKSHFFNFSGGCLKVGVVAENPKGLLIHGGC